MQSEANFQPGDRARSLSEDVELEVATEPREGLVDCYWLNRRNGALVKVTLPVDDLEPAPALVSGPG